MRRRNLIGICAWLVLLSGLTGSTLAYAYPGQTAAAMIAELGPLSNRYEAPPIPSRESLRTGRNKLDGVYWFGVNYDPVFSGRSLHGNLVAVFEYASDQLLRDGPVQSLDWSDIESYSEVFLAFVSDSEWRDVARNVGKSWAFKSQVDKRNADGSVYTLFDYVSVDKSLRLQISYTPERSADLAQANSGVPVFNFWSRLAPSGDPDWR